MPGIEGGHDTGNGSDNQSQSGTPGEQEKLINAAMIQDQY